MKRKAIRENLVVGIYIVVEIIPVINDEWLSCNDRDRDSTDHDVWKQPFHG